MGTNNGNGNPPKIELDLNQEARLKILKPVYEGKNSYGKYYLYSVEDLDTGETKSLFAPDDIHSIIREHKLGVGSEFLLKRVQNGKKGGSKLELSLVSAPPLLDRMSSTGDSLKNTMAQCLKEAAEITKNIESVPWRSEDIQKVGVALFIASTK